MSGRAMTCLQYAAIFQGNQPKEEKILSVGFFSCQSFLIHPPVQNLGSEILVPAYANFTIDKVFVYQRKIMECDKVFVRWTIRVWWMTTS